MLGLNLEKKRLRLKQIRMVLPVILLVGSTSSCKQTSSNEHTAIKELVEEQNLQLIPEKGIVIYENQPFTGTSVSYYSNGNKAQKQSFKNGILHGESLLQTGR